MTYRDNLNLIFENKTAVIIKGNPRWINNQAANDFYNSIAELIKSRGYDVSFDAGLPHTAPPVANLWVGHSRGADRLRFAPAVTKTINLSEFEHPVAVAHATSQRGLSDGERSAPPVEHFQVTDEMRKVLSSI